MKRINFDNVLTFDNLMIAYQIIKKNTEHKKKIVRYEMFLHTNLSSIIEELRDKVINHLISKYVLQPLITPKLISTNVATRIGKGGKAAIEYFKIFAREMSGYQSVYVLKLDIKKYFYNIDHEILNQKLKKLIKDDRLFQIVSEIVCSTEESFVNEEITRVLDNEISKTKDKRIRKQLQSIPKYENNKGLAIGSMSNQILALYYLNGLDHYIKEKLHIKRVIRYQDDYILFHYDKKYLEYAKVCIENELKKIKLELNDKTEIYNLRHGMPFIGYHFKLDKKRLRIKPTSKNRNKIKKRLSILKRHDKEKYIRSKVSYKGYFMVCR